MAKANGAAEARAALHAEFMQASVDFSPAVETLARDLRHAVLTRIRRLPRIWADLDDLDHGTIEFAVNAFCRELVKKAVTLIAAEDRPSVVVDVDTVAFKKRQP